jgi:hypothetical protein
MRRVLILLLSLFSLKALGAASECHLDMEKSSYRNREGVTDWDRVQKKLVKVYPTTTSLAPPYPSSIDWIISYRGSCQNLSKINLSVQRMIGPRKFAGDGGHKGHKALPVGTEWDKAIVFNEERVVAADKFSHLTVENIPFSRFTNDIADDKAVWRVRFIVDAEMDGKKLQFTHEVSTALIH